MAAVLIVALTIGASSDPGPHTNQERVYNIADTIKCPRCVGQSVAESDVAIAREIRTEIARAIDEGRTDDEIRDQIAAGYDEEVLLTPRASGVSGLVWILPVVAAVAALGGMAFVFVRWRKQGVIEATDDDRRLVDAARVDAARSGSSPDERGS
jgi:cytochrome c-type biogenesis protein CcmH